MMQELSLHKARPLPSRKIQFSYNANKEPLALTVSGFFIIMAAGPENSPEKYTYAYFTHFTQSSESVVPVEKNTQNKPN